VFYGAMLSSITPPVAMAAYAAAGLAGANPFKIALRSAQFGICAFILPFFFVLNPALIGIGSVLTIGIFILKAVVACVCLAFAIQGWAFSRLNMLFRVGFFIGALLTMMPYLKFSMIGGGLLASLGLFTFLSRPKIER
jgi:TRAP-type uncharacterized transport system fused permease subunit